tara:strand:- start:46 stop:642 length:597 start_codon:yes stop_codon:yes gene_type:complete
MPRVCSMGVGNGFQTTRSHPEIQSLITKDMEDDSIVNAIDTSKPIPDASGNIVLTHYSRQEGLTELDPTYMGRMDETGQTIGLRNSNFRQGIPAIPYTSYGLNVGYPEGYKKEIGLGDVEYTAVLPATRIYDIESDPEYLGVEWTKIIKERNINPMDKKSKNDILSKLILDAGYAGFFVSNGAGYGLTAAIFESLQVK